MPTPLELGIALREAERKRAQQSWNTAQETICDLIIAGLLWYQLGAAYAAFYMLGIWRLNLYFSRAGR